MMTPELLSYVALTLSIISLYISIRTYWILIGQNKVENLYKVKERLDDPKMRDIRRNIIYEHDSKSEDFTDEEKKKIDQWGAEVDIVARLFFSGMIDVEGFFQVYGDVLIRSACNLCGYANIQRATRGNQFWLQYQKLALKLLKLWNKAIKKYGYPSKIGFPNSKKKITIRQLLANEEFVKFITCNGLSVRI